MGDNYMFVTNDNNQYPVILNAGAGNYSFDELSFNTTIFDPTVFNFPKTC